MTLRIDHIQLRARDLDASRKFYRACLGALGVTPEHDDADYFKAGPLFVDKAEGAVSHVHLAFVAVDHDAVARFHAAGLAAGGRDNGAPGERSYHPGYFAAFLLDPDGNNIEAVYQGTATHPGPDMLEPGEGSGP
jgi:catechol 2,3-dioxygenase-like lactoylglutathione lyase family enzyme